MNQTQSNVTVTANNDWLTGGATPKNTTSGNIGIPSEVSSTPTVDVSKIQNPPTPLNVPTAQTSQTFPSTTTNYADQFLKQIQVEDTSTQKKANDLSYKIANLIPELQGESGALAQAQKDAGVNTYKQNLQTINNQIQQKTAEINYDDMRLSQSLQNIEDKPIAMEFITGQQQSVQRNAQIARAFKVSEIGMLNARALGEQGNIELAMNIAKQAVDEKYGPIQESITLYQKQLAALEPILTADEKKQSSMLQTKTNLAMEDLKTRQQNDLEIQKLVIKAAEQGADQSRLEIASKAKTPMEAATALGIYGKEYFANEKLDLELKKLQEDSFKSSPMFSGYSMAPTQLTNSNGITFEMVQKGVSQLESSQDYNVLGPVMKTGMYKGQQAVGKYQVMMGNIPSWTKQALGKSMTWQEFRSNPEAQEAVFKDQMSKYYTEQGNWGDAISKWFSGRPLAGNTASDGNMNTPEYVSKVMGYMGVPKNSSSLSYDDKNYTITAIKNSKTGKEMTGDQYKPIQKAMIALTQTTDLQKSMINESTGPILGAIRSANPYDTKAQIIKGQIQSLVPNLARGVYGEVGVLTDQDIVNYSKTLANLTSVDDVNKVMLEMTKKAAFNSIKTNLETLAASGRNVSGFEQIYTKLSSELEYLNSPQGTQNGAVDDIFNMQASVTTSTSKHSFFGN